MVRAIIEFVKLVVMASELANYITTAHIAFSCVVFSLYVLSTCSNSF